MKYRVYIVSLLMCFLTQPAIAQQTTISDIYNYRQYDDLFSSSGQPDRAQLQGLSESGFEQVIFIALATSEGALPDEAAIVQSQGMRYAHIPVEWSNPRIEEFNAVSVVLRDSASKKTLLHCQANYRASVFAFLYRTIYQGVSFEQAGEDLLSVWTPDETWQAFINTVLAEHDRLADCALCREWPTE